MTSRSVLITYPASNDSERNKVIKIPNNSIEPDIQQKCMMLFTLDSKTLVFQKFDQDWECYVDLNDEYVAEHKDRLKILLITCNDFVSQSDDDSDTIHQADDFVSEVHVII